MAQGCHLIYSHSDREHFPLREATQHAARNQHLEALRRMWSPDQSSSLNGLDTRLECLKTRMQTYPPEDLKFLNDILAKDPSIERDLVAGLGNSQLDPKMADKIPGAMRHLQESHPEIVGMIGRAGAHSSAWLGTLKNSKPESAAGIAFEVLATARMTRYPIESRSGKRLQIARQHELVLGRKYAAAYLRRGDIFTQDGWFASSFHQPDRITVEADLLICRPARTLGYYNVGVDFKHSYTGHPPLEQSQVDGVLVALKTGEIQEFHFASNTSFSPGAVEMIDAANAEIDRHNAAQDDKIPHIELFEHVRW